jgi:hypothetical protein
MSPDGSMQRPQRRLLTGIVIAALLASATVALAARHGEPEGARTSASNYARSARAAGFILRPLDAARGCTPTLRQKVAPAPSAVRSTLAILRTARRANDGLPVLNRTDGAGSEDQGWLAVHSYDATGVRRGPGSNAAYVVPSATVLKLTGSRHGAPCPGRLSAHTAGGACLVEGPAGGPLQVGCWTVAQIRAGRAIAIAGSGKDRRLVGLRPDGAAAMTVRGPQASTSVNRGSVIGQATRLGNGDRVTVTLTR